MIRAAAARTYPRSERPFVKKLIEDPDLASKMKDYLSGTLTKLTDLGATAFVLGKIVVVIVSVKVENILKGSLDPIPSPSSSV